MTGNIFKGEIDGSSPRTRGTVGFQDSGLLQRRFIPAHAGNSAASQMLKTQVFGSSPRTRGTVDLARPRLRLRRFIPAHAGNSQKPTAAPWTSAVHPRARGEQICGTSSLDANAGSSPRTRGTGVEPVGPVNLHRFIPAHAGNRGHTCRRRGWRAVHPRARGEQTDGGAFSSLPHGSSPRTRGTAPPHGVVVRHRRFIPAHAGNRSHRAARPCNRPVHPRARGEQTERQAMFLLSRGSSPRTRGTGAARPALGRWRRFIPAHAGNSHPAPSSPSTMAVHPRARGEQINRILGGAADDGSSPRTRGTGRRKTRFWRT